MRPHRNFWSLGCFGIVHALRYRNRNQTKYSLLKLEGCLYFHIQMKIQTAGNPNPSKIFGMQVSLIWGGTRMILYLLETIRNEDLDGKMRLMMYVKKISFPGYLFRSISEFPVLQCNNISRIISGEREQRWNSFIILITAYFRNEKKFQIRSVSVMTYD